MTVETTIDSEDDPLYRTDHFNKAPKKQIIVIGHVGHDNHSILLAHMLNKSSKGHSIPIVETNNVKIQDNNIVDKMMILDIPFKEHQQRFFTDDIRKIKPTKDRNRKFR